MNKTENTPTQNDDLSEVIITTFKFVKQHLFVLLLFTLIGIVLGYVMSITTPKKFSTSFVIENGGFPSEIVKVVAYPDSTQNFTSLSQKEYEKGILTLKKTTTLIADTTERTQTLKYNIELSDTSGFKNIEKVLIVFLKTNNYLNNYIKEEKKRITNEINTTNKLIETIINKLDAKTISYAEKNLSELLKRNESLNQQLKKLGRFDVLQPIQETKNESLSFSSFLSIGTVLGFVLGVVFGYAKDLIFRLK